MWPFRRGTDEDFSREIDAHIGLETDRLIAEGLTPEEARHAAARAFGSVAKTQEHFYESRRILWLDELRQDARYAVRGLRRSPGFAAVAILTLALGIGANTAIFSVVNTVLLRPLPYRDPGSLVFIDTAPVTRAPEWLMAAWRERARSLAAFAGYDGPVPGTLVATDTPVQIDSAAVSWNFFTVLGVRPATGRGFVEADAAPGAPAVAVLTHDCWIQQFGGGSGVLGRTVTLTGEPVTVVGVAPPEFRFPTGSALAGTGLPLDTQPDVMTVSSRDRSLTVVGRLVAGAAPGAAMSELLAIFKQEAPGRRFSPSLVERLELVVTPLHERLVGDVRQRMWLAMGAVGFVLLVACANVANLLLARASTRQRELALRTALGARKGRLARFMLTESILLALAGSVGALLLTGLTGGVTRTLLADRLPHVTTISLDWGVLGFNIAVATITGVLCGLASLTAVGGPNLVAMFSGSAAPTVTGSTGIRRALVSAEVAVTFILVVGAGLMVQTLWSLSQKDRGFEADGLLTVRVSPPYRGSFREAQSFFTNFFIDLTERIATMPEVGSAAAVSVLPFTGTGVGMGNVAVDGYQPPAGDESLVPVAAVSPGYFETMHIALMDGRDFDGRDRIGSEAVVIVNEAFRRRFAPGRDIVGARATFGNLSPIIVGVVGDVPDRSLREPPQPLAFFPLRQMSMHPFSWGQFRLVLRARQADPLALAPEIRRQIWSTDRSIVIDEIATMDERVAVTLRSERDSALLFGLFAVAALLMAAIGVYGVAAYSVAQRTKEIGIRMALGAARHHVTRIVVSQTLWPAVIGIVIGLVGASMLTRFVAAMVYGVTPLDPGTFVASSLLLVIVALAATWAPLRRATHVDPLVALRYE